MAEEEVQFESTNRSRVRVIAATALSLWVFAALSQAAAAAPGRSAIVVELSDGERAPDAAALLQPVYAELIKRGFVAQDKLVAVVDEAVSRSAGQMTASQSAAAQKLVEQGYDHFINGDYGLAIESEKQALALYQTAPATLAKEPTLRDLELKALLVTARSSEVTGAGEDAFGYMAEAIRTMPDRPLNAAEFDPQVKALYKRVKDELTKQGAGMLEVKVDDSTAVIFVDERFVGTGAVKLDGLLPGRYRVYVAKGDRAGRVREVEVPASGRASVDVSWQLDGTLRTGTGYVGLAGADANLGLAVKVARLVSAKTVVVLGIRTVDERRSIVAYSINTESQNKIYGAVQIEPISPPPATLQKLAALMAGDKIDAAGIITKEPEPATARPGVAHTLKWVFTAGAVVAFGAGGGLIAYDNKVAPGGERVRDVHATKNLGIGVAAGGAVLAAVAIYMFAADRDVEPEASAPHAVIVSPTVSPDSVGFALLGHF